MVDKKENYNKLPIGMIIIAIIYYLIFILSIGVAAISFFNYELLYALPGVSDLNPNILDSFFYNLSLLMIGLSIVSFITATGIFLKKNWARILLITICVLNIAGGILSITEKSYISIINLVFNLIILLYVVLSKKVRRAFLKEKRILAPHEAH